MDDEMSDILGTFVIAWFLVVAVPVSFIVALAWHVWGWMCGRVARMA